MPGDIIFGSGQHPLSDLPVEIRIVVVYDPLAFKCGTFVMQGLFIGFGEFVCLLYIDPINIFGYRLKGNYRFVQ